MDHVPLKEYDKETFIGPIALDGINTLRPGFGHYILENIDVVAECGRIAEETAGIRVHLFRIPRRYRDEIEKIPAGVGYIDHMAAVYIAVFNRCATGQKRGQNKQSEKPLHFTPPFLGTRMPESCISLYETR